MCVSNENTYLYIDLLIRELTEIFPYEYIHMGGDELSFYDMKDSGYWPNWYECDNCRCLAEKENFRSASDYYCHFVRRVYEIVKKHGRKLMIWNDSIDISVAPDLPRDILIQFWRVALDTRGPHEGCSMQRFLEEGFTVVNSFYEETYADDYMSEGSAGDVDACQPPARGGKISFPNSRRRNVRVGDKKSLRLYHSLPIFSFSATGFGTTNLPMLSKTGKCSLVSCCARMWKW